MKLFFIQPEMNSGGGIPQNGKECEKMIILTKFLDVRAKRRKKAIN